MMKMNPLSLCLPLVAMILHTPQDTSAQDSDPCHTYTVLNDTWRATSNKDQSVIRCDYNVQWQGWYRMFYQEASVLMPNVCVPRGRCGTNAPLWLNGPHPRPEDGIVTREVCGSFQRGCCQFKLPSIQVKACPGHYTVYKLVDPLGCELAYFAYCTDETTATFPAAVTNPAPTTPNLSSEGVLPTKTPASTTPILHTPQDTSAQDSDPCHNYTVLNDTWRATTNQDGLQRCDIYAQWQGWYRMFHQGASVLIPNLRVPLWRCGTTFPLWLNGPHPRPEDGIVTREVCALRCGAFTPPPIQVKACPGHYTVYKLVNPLHCNFAYCTDPTTATIPAAVTNPAPTTPILPTPQETSAQESDPCHNYTVLNDTWRATTNEDRSVYRCDHQVQWQGWYRMFYQEASVLMPNVCVPTNRCGTTAPLWLNGSHPRPEDGIVTREVCGSYAGNCCLHKSPSIQVKACPGNYTVYKLVDPHGCNFAYCTDVTTATIPAAVNNPAPTTPNHVVGLRLKVSSTESLTETEIEEQILKPFGDMLRAQGLDVTGIQLRRVYHDTGP